MTPNTTKSCNDSLATSSSLPTGPVFTEPKLAAAGAAGEEHLTAAEQPAPPAPATLLRVNLSRVALRALHDSLLIVPLRPPGIDGFPRRF